MDKGRPGSYIYTFKELPNMDLVYNYVEPALLFCKERKLNVCVCGRGGRLPMSKGKEVVF